MTTRADSGLRPGLSVIHATTCGKTLKPGSDGVGQRQAEQQVLRLELEQALRVHGQAEVDRLALHIGAHVVRVFKAQREEADELLLARGIQRVA